MTTPSTRFIQSSPLAHLGRNNRINQYLSVPVEMIPKIRYSPDYFTAYWDPSIFVKDGEPTLELALNQLAELKSEVPCQVQYGRALVTLNPALHSLFKEVVWTPVLEKGESPLIQGRTRKALTMDEVKALGWLYRVCVID